MMATTIPFFVTCGRGMEYFVSRELNLVSGTMNIDTTIEGKVFFEFLCPKLGDNVESLFETVSSVLLQLKSVERLFLRVSRFEPGRNAVDTLLDSIGEWQHKYRTWLTLLERPMASTPVATTESETENPSKKLKVDETADDISGTPLFRLSCKCAGGIARRLAPEKLSSILGKKIKKDLNWSIDLRNPSLEVFVHLNSDSVVVGFPLSKQPLSKRTYMKNISLRCTVCWSLAYLGDIKSSDTVLDPMCGKATILVEVIKSFHVTGVLGIDKCLKQLTGASVNLTYADVGTSVDLIQGTVEAMPLRSTCVDVILCDFPFGLQHETVESAKAMLPNALQEMNRVCRVNGRIVILIGSDLSPHLADCVKTAFPRPKTANLMPTKCLLAAPLVNSASSQEPNVAAPSGTWWKQIVRHYIKMGSLDAYVYKFQKKPASVC